MEEVAPRWRELSTEEQERARERGLVNGCGPRLGWVNYLVPDGVFGLCLTAACDEHDWDYTVGGTRADHRTADRRMRTSMLDRGRDLRTSWGTTRLRRLARIYMWPWHTGVALTYFAVVRAVTVLRLAGAANWPRRRALTRAEALELVAPDLGPRS